MSMLKIRVSLMSISTEEISNLIQAEFPDAEVEVVGGEGKYQVAVISDSFTGLNAVKRQQSIYRVINEQISSGAIHAVSMILKTEVEHQNK